MKNTRMMRTTQHRQSLMMTRPTQQEGGKLQEDEANLQQYREPNDNERTTQQQHREPHNEGDNYDHEDNPVRDADEDEDHLLAKQ